jgi:PAS domain S-box-containing protein
MQADSHVSPSESGKALGSEAVRPRQITKELLTVKRHFEVILESMKEGVLEVTSRGRIVNANRTALALTGKLEEMLLASHVHDIFQNSDQETIRRLMETKQPRAATESGEALFQLNGKQLMVKVLPLEPQDPGAIVILEDVTERKRMEEQLLRARKMEAVGTLAGGIAHDFNNILTTIFGSVSLGKLHLNPGDELWQRFEEIEQASRRAKELARQLLPFSRGGGPIRKIVSLGPLLEEICLNFPVGPDVRINASVPEDLRPVDVDVSQIHLAITQLLTNAVEAMPGGGTVEVRAMMLHVDEGLHLALPAGKYVKISIEDHGGGIPESDLDRIFEPYYSKRKAGRGLGLATVYSVMERHQGCVTVETREGVGSVFHLFIPAVECGDPKPGTRVGRTDAGKCRVLLMDDEVLVRKIAGQMLEHLGYSVVPAKDGEETIELYQAAQRNREPFDLVVLDLTVQQGMGGKEAAAELLRMDPAAKVIVSSGYSNDPVMSDHKAWGFKGIIEKPYQMKELQRELQRVIEDSPADAPPEECTPGALRGDA